jgi:CubicO group peptidase (beta-lactamase class C family)
MLPGVRACLLLPAVLVCFLTTAEGQGKAGIPLPSLKRAAIEIALNARIKRWILNRDFPGAFLEVRKGNNVIISRGWGETHYGSGVKPTPDHVYDLASVTKGIVVSLCLMHLTEQGKVQLADTLARYVKSARGFPLGRLTVRRLLAHKTGLPPYYFSNYWLLSKDLWNENSFSPVPTPDFPDPYRGVYLPKGYRAIMFRDLSQLPFRGSNRTVYSDLNYILLGMLIEEVTGKRLDVYFHEWIAGPMGLKRMVFNPLLQGIPAEQIVPTDAQPGFRGWVNDAEGAKLAGICGAAGLFSSGKELSRMATLLQQGGIWKGKRFIQKETLKKFAWMVEPGMARALGWQKPAGGKRVKTIAPRQASPSAFGHTGYTGCMIWVDPARDLSVVFLTNVTYPKDGVSRFKKNAGHRTLLGLIYSML